MAQLGHWAGDPWWAAAVHGGGRFVVVVLCAVVPAVLVWRRPAKVAAAVGLALVGFLFLSPAFGTQYLVWALGAAYLLSFPVGDRLQPRGRDPFDRGVHEVEPWLPLGRGELVGPQLR